MSGALLEVDTLSLGYGKIAAVKEISLSVNEGEVVCLIGANGAGKTTTLRGLSGLLQPRGGQIRFAANAFAARVSGYHLRCAAGFAHTPSAHPSRPPFSRAGFPLPAGHECGAILTRSTRRLHAGAC